MFLSQFPNAPLFKEKNLAGVTIETIYWDLVEVDVKCSKDEFSFDAQALLSTYHRSFADVNLCALKPRTAGVYGRYTEILLISQRNTIVLTLSGQGLKYSLSSRLCAVAIFPSLAHWPSMPGQLVP